MDFVYFPGTLIMEKLIMNSTDKLCIYQTVRRIEWGIRPCSFVGRSQFTNLNQLKPTSIYLNPFHQFQLKKYPLQHTSTQFNPLLTILTNFCNCIKKFQPISTSTKKYPLKSTSTHFNQLNLFTNPYLPTKRTNRSSDKPSNDMFLFD